MIRTIVAWLSKHTARARAWQACRRGHHLYRRTNRRLWDYDVYVCARGCAGEWAWRPGPRGFHFLLRPINRP